MDPNSNYYLYTGQKYWLMSPDVYTGDFGRVFGVTTTGVVDNSNEEYVNSLYGVRPVLSLKSSVTLTGIGTMEQPYVVQ